MRSLTADLRRIASRTPRQASMRSLVAALWKAAGAKEDKLLRAMFVEGAMGYTPNSISQHPDPYFDKTLKAIQEGGDDPILSVLRYTLGMSDREIEKLLGDRDTGIHAALVRGAQAGMGGRQALRGLMAEDIASAIAMGVSPLTLKSFAKYGPNRGLFQWLGSRAPKGTTVKGIASVAGKDAKNRALDILRKTRVEESTALDINAPAGGAAKGEALDLAELIAPDSALPRATYIDLATAIYNDPWVMGIIDRGVKSKLGGPKQLAVWTAIRQNPELIKVDSRSIGVYGKALAAVVSKDTGEEMSRKGATNSFHDHVLPAMRRALEDDQVAKRLVNNRQIVDVIYEATRRVDPRKVNLKNIRYLGDRPTPEKGEGAVIRTDIIPPPFDVSDAPPSLAQLSLEEQREFWKTQEEKRKKERAILQKLRSDPTFKAIHTKVASRRMVANVAHRFNRDKKAWDIPAKYRQMYKKLSDWAYDHLENFRDRSGRVDTDRLALALAREAGKPFWADEPTHWVYEIAYDMERAARRV